MSKSAKQVEAEFRADLDALLKKYRASIEAEDHYPGYPECGEDIRMTVVVPSTRDADGEELTEWAEFDIGKSVEAKEERAWTRSQAT